jgi:uncharacterized protein DUF5906
VSHVVSEEEFRERIAAYNKEHRRKRQATVDTARALSRDDFVAYMPSHNYIFKPTRQMWPAVSVNSRVPPVGEGKDKIPASAWLDANAPVEQATWAPGMPMIIRGKIVSDGGWLDDPNCSVFNLYRPPSIDPKPGSIDLWLDHIRRIYPDEAEHIIAWLAHRVQCPHEKINHALVLIGSQGIGKDTILEAVKQTVGPWNFAEISPVQALGRFNGFIKSVILRVSEVRDSGEFDRYALYEHMKSLIASPPDVLRVDEKHMHEQAVFNVTGVIITTNDKNNGLYLPEEDRRHFVACSAAKISDFEPGYFSRLYGWYETVGYEAVAYYLANLDIAWFDPKAPPPKTQAFWDIVSASRSPEDAELADAIDALGHPDAVTLIAIKNHATSAEFAEWLGDRKNSRKVPHRMEACGYRAMRNPDVADGLWKLGGKRQVIYVKESLSVRDGLIAAQTLTNRA